MNYTPQQQAIIDNIYQFNNVTPEQVSCEHSFDGPRVDVDHWQFTTSDTCSKCNVPGIYVDIHWNTSPDEAKILGISEFV